MNTVKRYIHHIPGTKLTASTDMIRITGHRGTWYVVETMTDGDYGDRVLFEIEHETYGDEAAHLIVDENASVVMEDVWNGFDDYLNL